MYSPVGPEQQTDLYKTTDLHLAMNWFFTAVVALSLFSAITAYADEPPSATEIELARTLQRIIDTCKTANDPDACTLDKVEKKRLFYESFLERTAPAAWPDVDITSFVYFHVVRQIAKEQIRCNALEASTKQACLDQVPLLIADAREEARHLLIAKGESYGNRVAAERNARDGRRRQEDANEQREHERELARIQAAGRALQGYGIGGGLFK